jgi:hypothetical protein
MMLLSALGLRKIREGVVKAYSAVFRATKSCACRQIHGAVAAVNCGDLRARVAFFFAFSQGIFPKELLRNNVVAIELAHAND